MLRKLQNLAELEQRWDNEKKDMASSTGRSPGEGFFVNYHLTENKLPELEMLCFITGAKFEEEDPELSVKELIVLVGQEKEKEDMSKVFTWMINLVAVVIFSIVKLSITISLRELSDLNDCNAHHLPIQLNRYIT